MSDNRKDTSELLKQISGQLGLESLSSDSMKSDEPVEEIEGSTDSQSKSQNPLLQYGIAAAIGLGLIGIPLSIMLGINGGDNNSTTAKLDSSKDKSDKVVSQTTNTDSAEVERLKTQVALDFQSKASPVAAGTPVAGTPGTAGTPAGVGKPTPTSTNQLQQPLGKQQTQAASTQELQPLGKQQTQLASSQAIQSSGKQQTQAASTQELQPLGKQQTQTARASLYPVAKPVPISSSVREQQQVAPPREEKFVATRITNSRVDSVEKSAPEKSNIAPRRRERFVRNSPIVASSKRESTATTPVTHASVTPVQQVSSKQRIARTSLNPVPKLIRATPDLANSRVDAAEKPQVAPRRKERFVRDRQIATRQTRSTSTSPVTRVVNPVQPPAPQPQQMGYQEAVALSMYGGGAEETAVKSASARQEVTTVALIPQLSPNLPLPIGVVVEGHTITPYNAISKGTATGGADIGVMLDRQIQLAQGYVLPIGTVIQFSVSVADNGMIQAVSKGVYINNTEIKAPLGAFSLTAENNTALIAEQRALRQGEITSSDIKTGLWGAAGTVGQVLVQSGNTTSIQTGGGVTSTVQTTNPTPNILGAVMQGAFQPLTQVQQQRSNAIAQEVQALSKINTLAINTKVKVFVSMPGVIQIPISPVSQLSQSINNSNKVIQKPTFLLKKLAEITGLSHFNSDRLA
jgi:hypothetical protein